MNPDHVDEPTRNQPSTAASHATEIRAAAAEVWRRIAEWRASTRYDDSAANQHRYDQADQVTKALADVPTTGDDTETRQVIAAVQPILTTWRTGRPGPEQAIYAAVERLRHAIRQAAIEPGEAR